MACRYTTRTHAHSRTLTHTSLGPVPLTPALQEALGARATYASDVDVTGTVFSAFSSTILDFFFVVFLSRVFCNAYFPVHVGLFT